MRRITYLLSYRPSPEAKPKRWQTLLMLIHVGDAIARLKADASKPKGKGGAK